MDWIPKLKSYPHFDKRLPEKEICALANSPTRVAKNAFYPFIEYIDKKSKFGRKTKIRPLRYASRRDSYIYAYYRHILSEKYENLLKTFGIQEHPSAYRKIPISTASARGKCNIHFAAEAFQEIANRGNCFVLALDISGFFESLDHARLYSAWCNILEVEKLPSDHQAIFKSVTKYSVVNRDRLYARLGYQNKEHLPTQLCSPKDFRSKVCGADSKYSSLITQNKKSFGIPQGSPISDLLANIYLIEFDCCIADFAKKIGGYYRRYSDDILFVCERNASIVNTALEYIKGKLTIQEKLTINNKKTLITEFFIQEERRHYRSFDNNNNQINKKLSYLGFSFDGKSVLIKDSTLSRYYRKITFDIKNESRQLVKRYTGYTYSEISKKINYSKFFQKYGKVEHYEHQTDSKYHNFWEYAKYSSTVFGKFGRNILAQLNGRNKKIKSLFEQEIKKKLEKKKL